MCKPGEPCNEQARTKTPNTARLFSRTEMLIVLAELFEANGVDAPAAAVQMLDVIGPLMMDTIRKATGWSHLQMAEAIIKQKSKLSKLYADAGRPEPAPNMLAIIVAMLNDDGENGAKGAGA